MTLAQFAGPLPAVAPPIWLDFLWLEITGKCNLACGHCYAESGPRVAHGTMHDENWLSVIDEAASLGCRDLQFIGGEPTIHPGFRTFLRRASEKNFRIEVYTNATRITSELAREFAARGVGLATSFYSHDSAAHDAVTARRGSWGRTVEGIEIAVRAGLQVRAGIIETQHNPGHVPQTKAFLNDLGVAHIGVDRERGIGRGNRSATTDPMSELCGQCWRGKLCVTPDGEVFPCVFSRFYSLGNAKDGITDILKTQRLELFRRELRDVHRDAAQPSNALSFEPDCTPCTPSNNCPPAKCVPVKGCSPKPVCDPGDVCTPKHCQPECSPAYCPPHTA